MWKCRAPVCPATGPELPVRFDGSWGLALVGPTRGVACDAMPHPWGAGAPISLSGPLNKGSCTPVGGPAIVVEGRGLAKLGTPDPKD